MAAQAAGRAYYYDPNRGPDRRRRPEGVRSKRWKVVNLQAIHHEIVRRLHKGQSNVSIAADLDVTVVMVSAVKNSPAVQAKLHILENAADIEAVDVRKEIIRRAPEALKTLHDLMLEGATTPTLKARIAMDQLDRAGHAPVRQIESKNLHAHRFVTDEDITNMKRRAIELGALDGTIVDQP